MHACATAISVKDMIVQGLAQYGWGFNIHSCMSVLIAAGLY